MNLRFNSVSRKTNVNCFVTVLTGWTKLSFFCGLRLCALGRRHKIFNNLIYILYFLAVDVNFKLEEAGFVRLRNWTYAELFSKKTRI